MLADRLLGEGEIMEYWSVEIDWARCPHCGVYVYVTGELGEIVECDMCLKKFKMRE